MTSFEEEAAAAERLDDFDAVVLAQLASLHERLDPVPGGLVDRIRFGITLDALHAEIAQLQRTGSAQFAGARAEPVSEAQRITFSSSVLTIMLTVSPVSADRVRVDGWVAPGADVSVHLRTPAGTRSTVADTDGRFVLDDVPRGFVQFVLEPPAAAGGGTVITPSIEL